MRTISSDLLTAQNLPGGSYPRTRAIVTETLSRVDTLVSSARPAWYSASAIKPQAYTYDPYRSGNARHRTLINKDGSLIGMEAGSLTESSLGKTMDVNHRPGLDMNMAYYVTGGELYRATLSSAAGWNVSAETLLPRGGANLAASALAATGANGVGALTLDNGGLRAHLIYNKPGFGWTYSRSPRRFVFPTRLADTTDLKYFAAAKITTITERTFFYVSDRINGNVFGIYFDHAIGDWSGVFEAMPANLSQYLITNAVSYYDGANYRIYLAGQFSRKAELATGQTYWMAADSGDGTYFTLRPEALLLNTGERYQLAISGGSLWGGNTNRVEGGTFQGQTLDLDESDILNFTDNSSFGQSRAQLLLANGDERWSDHALLRRGNLVAVVCGYGAGALPPEATYGVYRITGIEEAWADGRRELRLELTHAGMERLANFGSPYYTEISNLGAFHDGLQEVWDDKRVGETFFAAEKSGYLQDWIYVDLWDAEPFDAGPPGFQVITGANVLLDGGVSVTTSAGAHRQGIQSADLVEHLGLVDYPITTQHPGTGAISPVRVEIYATSLNEQASQLNDDFWPFLVVYHPDRGERIEQLCTQISTYQNPPQSWRTARAGSYPVVWEFAGSRFAADDQIKRVILINYATTTTKFIPLGVKVSGIMACYKRGTGSKAELLWKARPEVGQGCILKEKGLPALGLAKQPARAGQFEVWGKFEVDLQAGSSFGLVGLAVDGQNYVAARFRVTSRVGATHTGVYEIVIVRRGKEYLWGASPSKTWTNGAKMMFAQQGGNFIIRVQAAGAWEEIFATDSTTAALGPPAASEDVQHVGVYGFVNPAKMRVAPYAFREPEEENTHGDGIASLPGHAADLDAFPASGTVTIGEAVYQYGSKFTGTFQGVRGTHGPYQARRTSEWDNGFAVDFLLFDYGQSLDAAAGYLMASDNGYSWEISSSMWHIVEEGALLYRSRHWGPNVYGNYVGSANRVYLAEGLKDVTAVSNPKTGKLGDWAILERNESIVLLNFGASGGDTGREHRSGNIRSLIDQVCRISDVTPRFADKTWDEVTLTGQTPVYLNSASDLSVQDFEVSFYMPWVIADGNWIGITSDADGWIGGQRAVVLGIRKSGTKLQVVALDSFYNAIEAVNSAAGDSIVSNVRFDFHDEFCHVYDGEAWMHTFTFDKVDRPAGRMRVGLVCANTVSGIVEDVRLAELAHWRGETVTLELSTSAQSALSSILQERPVLSAPRADGSVLFSYFTNLGAFRAAPYALNGALALEVRKTIRNEAQAASDGVAHYAEGALTAMDPLAAGRKGFVTKLLNLSKIEGDEVYLTARTLIRTALEREESYSITLRPDLRVEVGDVATLAVTLSGTGTEKDLGSLVVEGVSLDQASNRMTLECRRLL